MEVILEVKAKKACVFNGFRRQTTKSTVSRPPVVHLSSPSAEFTPRFLQRLLLRQGPLFLPELRCPRGTAAAVGG